MVFNWIFFFIFSLGAVCGAANMGKLKEDSTIWDRIYLALETTLVLMLAIIYGVEVI